MVPQGLFGVIERVPISGQEFDVTRVTCFDHPLRYDCLHRQITLGAMDFGEAWQWRPCSGGTQSVCQKVIFEKGPIKLDTHMSMASDNVLAGRARRRGTKSSGVEMWDDLGHGGSTFCCERVIL
jgi:hypothetical protein